MTRFNLSPFLLFSVILIFMLAACSDSGETGEWEPVSDDDDSADDDDDNADDDDGCDCEVTEEEWQDLLDRCPNNALYEMFDEPTAESLCNECDACLVACFNNNTFCSTNFGNCFWDCV